MLCSNGDEPVCQSVGLSQSQHEMIVSILSSTNSCRWRKCLEQRSAVRSPGRASFSTPRVRGETVLPTPVIAPAEPVASDAVITWPENDALLTRARTHWQRQSVPAELHTARVCLITANCPKWHHSSPPVTRFIYVDGDIRFVFVAWAWYTYVVFTVSSSSCNCFNVLCIEIFFASSHLTFVGVLAVNIRFVWFS